MELPYPATARFRITGSLTSSGGAADVVTLQPTVWAGDTSSPAQAPYELAGQASYTVDAATQTVAVQADRTVSGRLFVLVTSSSPSPAVELAPGTTFSIEIVP